MNHSTLHHRPSHCPRSPPLSPQAIRSDHRVDGRRAFEHRPLQFQFASDDSSCIVRLGRTMAMATVSASLDAPYADRHSEGSVTFDVQPTAMAQGFGPDSQRRNEDAVELSRLVERGLKESRAVDLEALCVQPGRKVWHLQVDVRVGCLRERSRRGRTRCAGCALRVPPSRCNYRP